MGALSWLMRRPGQAVNFVEQAAREAIESRHGPSIIHCLSRGVIWTFEQCGDYVRARYYTEKLKQAIYHHGMAVWIPIAECHDEVIGTASGLRPSPDGLRSAVQRLQTATVQLAHPAYFATLINAMLAIGEVEDATRTLDFVLRRDPQKWNLPELLRLHAACERASGHGGVAETTLMTAPQTADEIGALGWKLRIAIDLAELQNGSALGARKTLAATVEQFTDGGRTFDLTRARELLAQPTRSAP